MGIGLAPLVFPVRGSPVGSADFRNLIAVAIGASQKLGMPHRRAGDEVLGDFVVALRELKKSLPYLFAVVSR